MCPSLSFSVLLCSVMFCSVLSCSVRSCHCHVCWLCWGSVYNECFFLCCFRSWRFILHLLVALFPLQDNDNPFLIYCILILLFTCRSLKIMKNLLNCFLLYCMVLYCFVWYCIVFLFLARGSQMGGVATKAKNENEIDRKWMKR